MGNRRMIDGDVTLSRSLNSVSVMAELTFFKLLTLADSHGRFVDVPAVLMAGTFPIREGVVPVDLEGYIAELADVGCLHRYEVDGREYCHFPKWDRYQALRKRGPSRYPSPEDGVCHQCCTGTGLVRTGTGVVRDRYGPPGFSRGDTSDQEQSEVEVEVEVEMKGREVEVEVTPLASHKTDSSLVPVPPAVSLELVDDELDAMAEQLVNVLARHDGTRETKVAWLRDSLPLMVCEVAALPGIETRQQANAKLRALVIRWWRQELKNPGNNGPENFDEARVRQGKTWLNAL